MKIIPYGKQQISDDDIQAVTNVLRSDFLTQGPAVGEFEQKFAEYVDGAYAVAVSSGTAALHLCTLALNVSKNDKVITSPITFAASANCVHYSGGQIDFADINQETYLIDTDKLEEKLKKAKPGEYKGIIPVDFAGYPVNLEKIRNIADKYGLWIIEDACHAPGGYFLDSKCNQQKCGNGNFADLAIFSFHPVKHIAAGEGGMITTNNKQLYEKLLLLRNHGITKDPNLLTENHGGWYYEMIDLGYNYRLTDIQSALGLSQLKDANAKLIKRKQIAEKYIRAFEKLNVSYQISKNNIFHAYHLFVIETKNRKKLYDFLRENNIYTQVHYIPVHFQPFYKKFGFKKGDYPVAESYYNRCLSLPMYPSLDDKEQDFVIQKVKEFFH